MDEDGDLIVVRKNDKQNENNFVAIGKYLSNLLCCYKTYIIIASKENKA